MSKPLDHEARRLVARRVFVRRLSYSLCVAACVVGVSLFAGVAGYHYFEGMPWIDAFVNAAMILSGMGPVTELHTWDGKFFAGCYALYSGLVLILVMGLMLAPVVHFVLHRFHLEMKGHD